MALNKALLGKLLWRYAREYDWLKNWVITSKFGEIDGGMSSKGIGEASGPLRPSDVVGVRFSPR